MKGMSVSRMGRGEIELAFYRQHLISDRGVKDGVKILAHRRSRYAGEDQALVIPRGDLLCWSFIALLKFQISNPNYQTNSNDQNSK